jgi:signal transduction histidine kinase
MAIENERLQAEVRAQLEEVLASRQRIVEAADRERRRVERNLHDGAQQRLIGAGVPR